MIDSVTIPLGMLRDELLALVRSQRVPGVISAGIGRSEGKPALVLLVRPGYTGGAPLAFKKVPVVVRQTQPASAFFAA